MPVVPWGALVESSVWHQALDVVELAIPEGEPFAHVLRFCGSAFAAPGRVADLGVGQQFHRLGDEFGWLVAEHVRVAVQYPTCGAGEAAAGVQARLGEQDL